MKLNKSKNKGKVHPSPSSSLSTVSTLNDLLPAAILTLISILSLPDKEVLAYMITHSLSSTTSSSFPTSLNNKNSKKSCTKKTNNNTTSGSSTGSGCKKPAHNIPTFDCGCFECYTSYWTRWDSSPNRELIHQAIEAFEEHLATCEQQKNTTTNNSPSKSSSSRRKVKKEIHGSAPASPQPSFAAKKEQEEYSPEIIEVGPSENGETFLCSVESPVRDGGDVDVGEYGVQQESNGKQGVQQQQQQHKGLARKVLPDVIGLFNSRLWNLWGPNV